MAAATLVTCYQLGPVFQQNTSWAGFLPLRVDITGADRARHANLYALIDEIPADASVAASEMLVAHVSSRKNAYTLLHGHYDADYILARIPPVGHGPRTPDRGAPDGRLRAGRRERATSCCFAAAPPATRPQPSCFGSALDARTSLKYDLVMDTPAQPSPHPTGAAIGRSKSQPSRSYSGRSAWIAFRIVAATHAWAAGIGIALAAVARLHRLRPPVGLRALGRRHRR